MKKRLLTLTLALTSLFGFSQSTYHAADECVFFVEDTNNGVTTVNSVANPAPDVNNMNTNVTSIEASSAGKTVTFILPEALFPGDTFKMKYYTANDGANGVGSGRLRVRLFNDVLGNGSDARNQVVAINNTGGSWQIIDEVVAENSATASITDAGGYNRMLIIHSLQAAVVEPMYIDAFEGSRVNTSLPAVLADDTADLDSGNQWLYNNSPDAFNGTASDFIASTVEEAQATPTTNGNSSPTVLKITRGDDRSSTGAKITGNYSFDYTTGNLKFRIYPECNPDVADPNVQIRVRANSSGDGQIVTSRTDLVYNTWNEVSIDLSAETPTDSGVPNNLYDEIVFLVNQGDSSEASNGAVFYIDAVQTPAAETLSTDDLTTQETTITAYPNPVTNTFQLNANTAIENVKIYNITGRLLKTFDAKDNYDISDLATGIYLVNVKTPSSSKTLKIVKK
ncbi:T9SS type A sorting domain-containing protein [Wenyingzhuangia sp. 2_MG-2023]|uniref:T9SS type A sorting domain-containing protein n=1 Tax=Wenyingzhuangia sp. 2_MG-2023 TaxID=3062639 RepID=UPI0026E4654E|nr:T9SS type A sorting domain-containing protein [Wenyingzhuangia sp. 2_MG-2023]MDO6736314.1 T9SS type A sorting domain-containing protein [Wenyingzhuangia sp. 2_MG-2023]